MTLFKDHTYIQATKEKDVHNGWVTMHAVHVKWVWPYGYGVFFLVHKLSALHAHPLGI